MENENEKKESFTKKHASLIAGAVSGGLVVVSVEGGKALYSLVQKDDAIKGIVGMSGGGAIPRI